MSDAHTSKTVTRYHITPDGFGGIEWSEDNQGAWVRYDDVVTPEIAARPDCPHKTDAPKDAPRDPDCMWCSAVRYQLDELRPAGETTSTLDSEFEMAVHRAGIREPLLVYTSNSYRRVGLKREYKEVLSAIRHNDGQTDISNTPLLEAMVAAFNAMLARGSPEKAPARQPGPYERTTDIAMTAFVERWERVPASAADQQWVNGYARALQAVRTNTVPSPEKTGGERNG